MDNNNYKITNKLSEHHIDQLHELYKKEWWSEKRTREQVDLVLKHTSIIIGIIEKETDTLVAFSRILTDYCKYAYVYDVIVNSNFRKQGLGKVLLQAVLDNETVKDLKYVELTCRKNMIPFYEKFGFDLNYANESVPMRRLNENAKLLY